MKKILWGLAIIVIASIVVIACRKSDVQTKENSNLAFDVEASKEWWYGSFRKSTDYQTIDLKSPIAPSAGTSTKKYPNWKKAIGYTKSGAEVVELPLHYETNRILLLGMPNLSKTVEGARIASASVHRLLLFRTSNKETVVRTVTVIPSAEYAKKNNYDITFIRLDKLPSDFDGHLIIAGWDQRVKNIMKIVGGKPVKRVKIISAAELAQKQKSGAILDRQVCSGGYWATDREWVCVIVPTGDQAADDARCQEQGYWVEVGQHWVEGECIEVPDDPEEPVDECLNSGDPGMCYCLMYALPDCEGGELDPGEDEEDCVLKETLLEANATDELESSSTNEVDAVTRTKGYRWKCLTAPTTLIHWISVDSSIQKKVGGSWRFQSLTHKDLEKHGSYLGVVYAAEVKSWTPTVGLYNAVMSLHIKYDAEAVCRGFPLGKHEYYDPAHYFGIDD